MGIERQEAAEALNDVAQIARRVRQSRIYQLSSSLMVLWGALVIAGNMGSFLWPRSAGFLWLGVHATGIAGSFALSAASYSRTGSRTFDSRMFLAFLLFIAFGIFTCWLGNFNSSRQIGTFWAIYFMLVYTIAGLWVGQAYVAIGLSIAALTLNGYFVSGSNPGWRP
jgi:hypothetical protein